MPESRAYPPAAQAMSPEEVATRTFPTARRGLEAEAVRRFLADVAGQLRETRARETELAARLAEAEARAAAPELDEAALTAAVGTETARVLRVAHEAAQEVVAKAEARAAALLEEARQVHEAREATAEVEAARIREEGRLAAEDLVERTKQECRSMLEEAREARRRVLDDLAARRRELHGQIGQLRAAKDALFAIVDGVASEVGAVRDRLAGSEDEARGAAEAVAHELAADGGRTEALDAEALGFEPAPDGALPAPAAAPGPADSLERPVGPDRAGEQEPDGPDRAGVPGDEPVEALRPGAPAPEALPEDEAGSAPDALPEDEAGSAPDALPEDEAGSAPDALPEEQAAPAPEVDGEADLPEDEVRAWVPDGDLHPEDVAPLPVGPDDEPPEQDRVLSDPAGDPAVAAPAADYPSAEGASAEGASAEGASAEGASAEGASAEGAGPADGGPEDAGSELDAASREPVVAQEAPDRPGGGLAAAAPAPEETTEGDESEGDEDPGRAVEALFARIRASRAEEVARARAVLGGSTGGEVAPSGSSTNGVAAPDEAAAGLAVVRIVPEADETEADETEADGAEADETEADGAEADRDRSGGDPTGGSFLTERDEQLELARAEVSRAIKRVLRSQQNELLDTARSLKVSEGSALLAGEEAEGELAEASVAGLEAAFRAGRGAAGAVPEVPEASERFGAIARAVAAEVVGAIRGRLAEELASLEASGALEEGLGELVGVAYRDWKGARVDGVASDATLRAFAAGTLSGAAAGGRRLRWVLASDQPCADCDDNALSEPLVPGEAFPTGQAQPPLHSGCRCGLVPEPG